MNNQKQILALIENDIINSKLMSALNHLGIDASLYLNDLSQVIFIQVGIRKKNRTEILYKKYFDLMKQAEYLDLKVGGEKTRLAKKIYDFLIANI